MFGHFGVEICFKDIKTLTLKVLSEWLATEKGRGIMKMLIVHTQL